MKQSTNQVSYEKEKIQYIFTLLNSLRFTGIQQADGIVQIVNILNNPITNTESEENVESEV
jgi:hypothetical protein